MISIMISQVFTINRFIDNAQVFRVVDRISLMRIQLKQFFYPIIVVSGLFIFGCDLAGAALDDTRPQAWAIPLKVDAVVPNLYRINSTLYRSAQPTPEGFSF